MEASCAAAAQLWLNLLVPGTGRAPLVSMGDRRFHEHACAAHLAGTTGVRRTEIHPSVILTRGCPLVWGFEVEVKFQRKESLARTKWSTNFTKIASSFALCFRSRTLYLSRVSQCELSATLVVQCVSERSLAVPASHKFASLCLTICVCICLFSTDCPESSVSVSVSLPSLSPPLHPTLSRTLSPSPFISSLSHSPLSLSLLSLVSLSSLCLSLSLRLHAYILPHVTCAPCPLHVASC